MPEQRKRVHCVAEITLSTTFLLASEVPAMAAFARSGLHQEPNFKTRQRGTINLDSVPRSRFGLPKTLQNSLVGLPISGLIRFVITERNFGAFLSLHFDRVIFF